MRYRALWDDQWNGIKKSLPGKPGDGTAKDNRLFVEVILYRYRGEIPWLNFFGEVWRFYPSTLALPVKAKRAYGKSF
ncbi:hypothetical protein P618_200618 [Holospora obtusa F1]|uniref:Transposase n=1 Tax=Holospora obtusa F1 TaxID=1399147 RepID=W6TDQ9_HOLOB|nr:hypothetical protein P618_200618 [Holospora obtusa F1]